MKQIPDRLRFFAVMVLFSAVTLLVFLVEKSLVQNFKKDQGNSVKKYNKIRSVPGNNMFQ